MAPSFAVNALLVVLALTSFAAGADVAGKPTTVSLTASVHAEANAADQKLVASLLPLLEVDVASRPQFSVVERRQIDLALLELALSEGLAENSNARLQLGKIASADLIVTLKLLEPDAATQSASDGNTPRDDATSAANDEPQQRVLVRVVESLTGVIRGVAVVTVDEARLDETATQIADYLSLIRAQPERPLVTVAVAPFESLGRFDRLRPLELGLRDMVATRLRLWSDRLARGEAEADGGGKQPTETTETNDSKPQGFRVLQRSNMQELLREFDLIQSALVDRSRLPKTLPTRAAAFLVRGTVDKKNDGGRFRVVVTGELIHAASNKAVRDFQFETEPEGLEVALAHQVDQFAGRLVSSSDEVSKAPGTLRERNEVDSLFEKVASDLRRFHRTRPIDFSHRGFELPGRWLASGSSIAVADSPLGRALLKKSIDRLESTLFIRPDRTDAAYALGFCYSFHIPEIWNSERADELLRRAAAAENDELRAVSLRLLAEISFHHHSGRVPDGQYDRAAKQLLFAFQNMPDGYRDQLWARLPSTLAPLLGKIDNKAISPLMLESAATAAEKLDAEYAYQLALGVRSLTGLVSRSGNPARIEQIDRLERWAEGDQIELKKVGAWTLGQRAEYQKDFPSAARWYLIAANALKGGKSTYHETLATTYPVAASRCLRLSGQPAEALKMLESFKPHERTSLAAGRYAVEIGLCYRDLKQPSKALEVMVGAAERVPSLRDNSPVEEYIRELGGVPLREDHDIDVAYFDGPTGKPLMCRVLATDGSTLFCAGGFLGGVAQGVLAFEPQTETWRTLTTQFGRVTTMAVSGGDLWVGTASDGVWRGSLKGGDWKQWSTAEELSASEWLPDNRVISLAASEAGVYVGLGTGAAGGVIRINADGSVKVLDGEDAPAIAPSHLVVLNGHLLATTRSTVHELDPASGKWTTVKVPSGPGSVAVFAGMSHVWASTYGREIVPFNCDAATANNYRDAWFSDAGKAGYSVEFVIERGGRVWFGGSPWARFRSAGFYSIDPDGGDFRMYGLRDGFRMSTTYSTYAGVTIDSDLWLATSAGLTRVTPR